MHDKAPQSQRLGSIGMRYNLYLSRNGGSWRHLAVFEEGRLDAVMSRCGVVHEKIPTKVLGIRQN